MGSSSARRRKGRGRKQGHGTHQPAGPGRPGRPAGPGRQGGNQPHAHDGIREGVAPPPVMWPDAGSGFEADPFSPAGTAARMWSLTAAPGGRGRQALLGQMVLLAIFAATGALGAAASRGQNLTFTAIGAVVAVAAAFGAFRSWRAWRAADRW